MEAIETTAETKIETGLQILDQREVKLIELADKYKDLKISGSEDKDGYKKVREARIELKNERVAVENDAYALRENAIKFQKAVITREKQLVGIISTTEKTLQEEEDKYKKEIEAIRVEKERREQERIQKRINSLARFNCAIDLYDATTMPDDKFNELLTQAETDFNAEQDRIAQEKVEQERLRNQEAERLKAEREELAKQRAENERVEREFKAEQLKVKQELEARERELQVLERARIEAARREKKEQEEKEAAMREERQKFEEEKRQHEEQIRLEQSQREAADRARIEEQERIKREAEEIAAAVERDKKEAIRQEALKPDKEKLFQYARALMAIPVPELVHNDAQKIIGEISERVVQTAEFIHDKAVAL